MSIFTPAAVSFAVAAASLAAAAPASAAVSDESVSVEVRHGDLDLTRASDVARLNRRIAYAARAVCGSYDIRDLRASARVTACRDEAIAAAAPKVELAVVRAGGGSRLAVAPPAGMVAVP